MFSNLSSSLLTAILTLLRRRRDGEMERTGERASWRRSDASTHCLQKVKNLILCFLTLVAHY